MPADTTQAPPLQQIIELMEAGHCLVRVTTDLAVTRFRFELHTPDGVPAGIRVGRHTVTKLIKQGLIRYGPRPAHRAAPWPLQLTQKALMPAPDTVTLAG